MNGSSCGHSRIIRYLYAQDRYAKMMPECYQFWRKLEDDVNKPLLK